MKTKSELVSEIHDSGFNCAQSVFSLFCEKYGMDKEQGLKVSCGLGGGVRSGEVCGAVSGAVLVIGLKYGHCIGNDDETKKNCYAKTIEFLDAFKSKNTTIICRELLGIDISVGDGFEQAKSKNVFKTKCAAILRSSVETLEELGY